MDCLSYPTVRECWLKELTYCTFVIKKSRINAWEYTLVIQYVNQGSFFSCCFGWSFIAVIYGCLLWHSCSVGVLYEPISR